ncbi:MAG: ABC transporter permease [Eubacteriales bacterium]|nr:ABC transporter permease [Eubacteriales bacterium]
MKQFFTVLKFELGNYFKNKSFLITTLVIAVIAVAAVAIPPMIPGLLSTDTVEQILVDGIDEESRIGIVDPDDVIGSKLAAYTGLTDTWVLYEDAEKMREDVQSETLDGAFLIQSPTEYTYIVQNNSLHDVKSMALDQVMELNFQQTYLTEKGLTAEEIQSLMQTEIISHTEILGKDSSQSYWYTYILIFALYFLILLYGQMIAVSVTTEKSNRAIEILVTSVNPNSLIVGKVVAGAASGIIQMGVILGAAFGSYAIFRESWGNALDFLFHVPTHVWAVYIVFGILGYLLYAFLFGMLGALVSKTEDISKSSSLVVILYMVSFFIAMFGMGSSDSLLMKAASFVPFTSTNAMLCRVTMGTVALWEILLSAGLLVVSCILVGLLAAKMFRFGTLMYGNPIKFTTALQKIRSEGKTESK